MSLAWSESEPGVCEVTQGWCELHRCEHEPEPTMAEVIQLRTRVAELERQLADVRHADNNTRLQVVLGPPRTTTPRVATPTGAVAAPPPPPPAAPAASSAPAAPPAPTQVQRQPSELAAVWAESEADEGFDQRFAAFTFFNEDSLDERSRRWFLEGS